MAHHLHLPHTLPVASMKMGSEVFNGQLNQKMSE